MGTIALGRLTMRISIACLAALSLLPLACAGDDGNDDPTVATSFPMMTAADDSATGNDDGGTATAGDAEGTATMGMADTAADTGSGDNMVDTGMMTASSDGLPPASPTCQHQCTVPGDCFIGGEETAFQCNNGACTIACTTDPECVAIFSGWNLVPCDGDGDCADGVCVDTGGGVGGCSFQPSQGPCMNGLVETMAPAIGGGMIPVCGQPDAICGMLGGQNTCFVDCVGNPCQGELTCEMDGLCHCQFDTQCVDANLGNNCSNEGLCEFTCTDPATCPAFFDGGTFVCE
ncbi:MAG: hypothetical protein AAF721_37775 [Myxococcota bacterium]